MFNIFSTLKQNVGNVAGTINQNLQNFGGDVYDAYSGAKQGISQGITNTKNAVSNVGSTIGKNVSNTVQGAENFARQKNYQAWDSIMNKLPSFEQAKSELSRNTGGYDQAKLENIFRDMQSKGYSAEQANKVVEEIDRQNPSFLREKTFGDKVRQSALQRGEEFGKTYNDLSSGKIGFGEATLRNAGDILGLAGGVAGNVITQIPGVETGLRKIGETAMKIPGVKQGTQAYGEFAKANPRAAENLQAIGNIGATALGSTQGQAMIAKGVSKAGEGIKKVAEPAIEKTSQLVNKVSPYIDEATMGVKKGVGNLTRSVTSTATGLEGETISLAKNKPNLFKQARTGALDRETVTGQAVDAIQSRLDDLSEIGKGYDLVRKNAVVASGDDISNVYLKNAGNISTKQLTKADNSTLKDLSDYMSEYKGKVTDADLMALRRQVDSVLYDPNTGFPRKLTPQAKQVVSGVRADIDSLAKSKIPGLAELDAKYAPEVGLLRKVKKEIFNADGTLKDNAISSISNITGKGKEAKLARLEQIMPGLGDKVSAVKAYEDVLKASGNKVGNYARGALAIGGASINPGLIAGWVATHPRVVSFMLEKYGLSKQAIKEILAKKTFSSYDTKVFSEALKKVPKSDINKFILNTKLPPILPYNYTERGTKKSSTP